MNFSDKDRQLAFADAGKARRRAFGVRFVSRAATGRYRSGQTGQTVNLLALRLRWFESSPAHFRLTPAVASLQKTPTEVGVFEILFTFALSVRDDRRDLGARRRNRHRRRHHHNRRRHRRSRDRHRLPGVARADAHR